MESSFNEIAFLDTETTGFKPEEERVIEIAVVRMKNGEITDEFHSLINPERLLTRDQLKITGIRNRELVDAPKFADIAPRLRQILRGSLFVAHNVEFDYGFISAEFGRIGEPFSSSRLCTVELSREIYSNYSRHNLDAIAARHNIAIDARHRALDDTKAMLQFYQIALNYYGEENFAQVLKKLTKAPKNNRVFATPAPQLSLL